MLAVSREELNRVAEHLAVLHHRVTDPAGYFVAVGSMALPQYPAAVMAALVMLSGGEAIGYQGDTHVNILNSESFHLKDPNK